MTTAEPPRQDPTSDEVGSFAEFRESFYYGSRANMQFKHLRRISDAAAADEIAAVLEAVGEVLDTGDLAHLRRVVYERQVAAYAPSEPVEPEVDERPFTPLVRALADVKLALVSAGGVFVRGEDPMGPDGPTQRETEPLIKEFLRGAATLSEIPVDTPMAALTARHPGYDALTAQRDPQTVFPLGHLRDLADDGRLTLADTHYAFTGATSQRRLEKETAPQWAERFVASEVDAVLLVAT